MAEANEWQPIENAPMNGTPVLVFEAPDWIDVARWWDGDDYGHNAGWLDAALESKSCNPTHWRPLPAPPQP